MMTHEQVQGYGTLLGIFLAAAWAEFRARGARQTAVEAKQQVGEIHNLVNGGRLQDLSKLTNFARRIADITHTVGDAEAYELAKKDLEAHQAKFTTPLTTTDSTPTTPP